ncbi:MAG: hypothetical protein JW787_07275 [Sedimentisphaerales bacterium]|nr:hypothetical protein [Sedimentisphaerales bacterium]
MLKKQSEYMSKKQKYIRFRFSCFMLFLFCVMVLSGCANVRITDPARTATEQFLLSEAAVKAVDLLSFESLHGRTVFLDANNFSPAEKDFVLSEFRARLLLSGVSVSAKKGDAEIVVEVRSGGVGIDRYEALFGIPSFATPTALTNTVTLVTPEIAITKKIRQIGFASVSYVAYWADTGEIVASSGPAVGKSNREDWWLFGFGPNTIGDIPPVDYKTD